MNRDALIHSLSNTVWLPLLPAAYMQSCRFSCLFSESNNIKLYFLHYFFIHSHVFCGGDVNSYFCHNLRDTTPGLSMLPHSFALQSRTLLIIRVLNVIVSSTSSTIGLLRPKTLEILFCLFRKFWKLGYSVKCLVTTFHAWKSVHLAHLCPLLSPSLPT